MSFFLFQEANAEKYEQGKKGETYLEGVQDLKYLRPAEQKEGVSGRSHGWDSSQVGVGLKGGWPIPCSVTVTGKKSGRADASGNDVKMQSAEQSGALASGSEVKGSSGKEEISSLLESCIARVSSSWQYQWQGHIFFT